MRQNPNGSSTVTAETMLGALSGNGVADLRALDENADGVVNSQDSGFADLRVWLDANSDGRSTANEIKTLASLNITGFDTRLSLWVPKWREIPLSSAVTSFWGTARR